MRGGGLGWAGVGFVCGRVCVGVGDSGGGGVGEIYMW